MEQVARRRAGVLGAVFFCLFFALLVRLYTIQVSGHETYAAQRESQSTGRLTLEPVRGIIRDAGGEILAVSVPVESVWVNPSAIDDPLAAARLLAPVLSLPPEQVRERLLRGPDRKFVWLKRKVSAAEADAVRRLLADPVFKPARRSTEPKLGLTTEFARRYPQGTLLSHVLGFFGGMPEGLERSLDSALSGNRRTVEVSLDARRAALGIPSVETAGAEVSLTINLHLQKIVEEELDALVAEHQPKWASVVVMDPQTGALLALSNRPTFDPNAPAASPADARLNRAVAVPYEPGSTLKPFHCVYALELGLVKPETKLDGENGLWSHGPRRLHDHHPYGMLTVADAIKVSSNIVAAKIGALVLGRKRLHTAMTLFGFGSRTGVDLPAEDDGRLFPLSRWNIYSETSVPMGHEISVTTLQLVAAMSAIANGGTYHRPYAVRSVRGPDGVLLADAHPQAVRQVVGKKAAGQMIEILESVVKEGTGKKAQVDGVRVGGKTGTTQKVDPRTGQYGHEHYISSFVGFAPAEGAKLCIAVVVDEPKGAYYGGTVAAPVVGRIIKRGLVFVR